MRFTLLKMFVVVAMVGLACAALIYRTGAWASIIMSVTIALYAIVALHALGEHAQERASSAGFAIVGSAYLLLATCTLFGGMREWLCTNYALAFAARTAAIGDQSLVLPSYLSLMNGTAVPVPWVSYPAYAPATTPTPAVTPYLGELSTTTTQESSTESSVPTIEPADDSSAAGPATAGAVPSATLTPVPSTSYAPPYVSAPPVAGALSISASWTAAQAPVMPLDTLISLAVSNNTYPVLARFFLIGHCVWSWLFALAGGWFAGRMYASRHGRPAFPAASS